MFTTRSRQTDRGRSGYRKRKSSNSAGNKSNRDDKVAYGGQTLKREVLRYVLLNKPKGFLTTADDPLDRKQ